MKSNDLYTAKIYIPLVHPYYIYRDLLWISLHLVVVYNYRLWMPPNMKCVFRDGPYMMSYGMGEGGSAESDFILKGAL